MKAITIKQPWATLIALGEKQFETRSWQTKYRGLTAIHAGKSIDKEACKDMAIANTLMKHGIKSYKDLPTGAVLATANLLECHKVLSSNFITPMAQTTGPVITNSEFWFGDYTVGRYAWELSNVEVLQEPIKSKGQLSLWDWEKKR